MCRQEEGDGMTGAAGDGPVVLTLGHSTRPIDAFLDLLRAHGCRTVIDVRSLPRSRRHPQFDRAALAGSLASVGIAYRHCAPLGGLRDPRPPGESLNAGLRNERFRAYADHMQSREFGTAVDALVDVAGRNRCAVICAEALPWRCHRYLLADALVARGCRVVHVLDGARALEHRLRAGALIAGGTIRYPADGAQRRLDL
jgi:uncharacterized protein (DUF488 family)